MATIRARKRADGTVSYTAQIRINRDGAQVYQETQTFARKQAAQAGFDDVRLSNTSLMQFEKANRVGVPLSEIIDRYLVEVEKPAR